MFDSHFGKTFHRKHTFVFYAILSIRQKQNERSCEDIVSYHGGLLNCIIMVRSSKILLGKRKQNIFYTAKLGGKPYT